jgi:hypothetical protein
MTGRLGEVTAAVVFIVLDEPANELRRRRSSRLSSATA